MKELLLHNGMVSKVDDDVFDWASRLRWTAWKKRKTWYAVRQHTNDSGKQVKIYLHRQILGLTNPKDEGHHEDGDGLNNQRKNLLCVTRQQNSRGFRNWTKPGKLSRFRGVSFRKYTQKWRASICVDGKYHSLGDAHASEMEAAKAYDQAAKKLFGRFAQLNLSS